MKSKNIITGVLALILTMTSAWAGKSLEITKQPESQTVKAGESVTFSIEVEEDENIELAMEMEWCPPGSFVMGSPETELDRFDIEYLHQEIINQGFYLGKYEVTQAQYKSIMGKNPSEFSGDNNPVEQVTWYDAMVFCEKLTRREHEEGRLPEGYEYTLPTEAQWEYACRAGTTTAFNNGTNIPTWEQTGLGGYWDDNHDWHVVEREPCPNLDEVGWYRYNSNDTTHPVGQKRPNAWGLYDMHGNVWEWCLNGYARGGSWFNRAGFCRSAKRVEIDMNNSANIRGFRVALLQVQAQASAATDTLSYQWYKDGEPIYDATFSSYTIDKVKKEDEGSYWVTITNGTNTVISDVATLTVELSEPPEISMYRVKSVGLANASAGYGADEPLVPVANEEQLASALEPVSKGLVADGVTPLVFKLHFPGKAENETQWKLGCSYDDEGGGYTPCFLHLLKDDSFQLLSRYELSNGEMVLTVPAHPEGGSDIYMYMEAVSSEEMDLGSYPCRLTVTSMENEEINEELGFKICQPPLVLIHGFNTKGEWGEYFKRGVAKDREQSLVKELHYGVFDGDYTANTYGTFAQLTKLLNATLLTDVEGLQGPTLWDGWACTRYDVVCHSQGGVLTRLLCSKDPVWSNGFRSEANHYRGRFNRIVTIGSPQNGTSLLYYLLQMKKINFPILDVLPASLTALFQSRFDPWGREIRQINNIEIDPAAKFHAVGTEVNSKNNLFVLAGLYLGEYGRPGADILLPKGSDSVVNLESQQAGAVKNSTYFNESDRYVAHAAVVNSSTTLALLGTYSVQTTSFLLASYVNKLFENNDNFGPFIKPEVAAESWKKEIDNYIASFNSYAVNHVLDLVIDEVTTKVNPVTGTALRIIKVILEQQMNNNEVESATDSENETVWIAEVYGPNGVTTDGVTLEEDNEHEFGVNVVVEDSVVGEVILYGCVQAGDGKLYYGKPTMVYSNPPGESIESIECVPSVLTMAVGDTIKPELWATYENGVKSRLFVGADTPLIFRSSDPQIVEVNVYGLEALKEGIAVISVEYKGLRTSLQYKVGNDDSDMMLFSCGEGGLTLIFAGTLQESTDMKNWRTLEEAESPYTVQTIDSQKFYRSFLAR